MSAGRALFDASDDGDVDGVRAALENGADVDWRNIRDVCSCCRAESCLIAASIAAYLASTLSPHLHADIIA